MNHTESGLSNDGGENFTFPENQTEQYTPKESKEAHETITETHKVSFEGLSMFVTPDSKVTAKVDKIHNSGDGEIKLRSIEDFEMTLGMPPNDNGDSESNKALRFLMENGELIKNYIGSGDISEYDGSIESDTEYLKYKFGGGVDAQDKLIELMGWEDLKNDYQENLAPFKINVVEVAHKLGMK